MKNLMIIAACMTLTLFVKAQGDYKLLTGKVQIAGTSTLHDWTADVTKTEGTAALQFTNGTLTGIRSLSLRMDAGTIKSKKGAAMDKNLYKALKTDKYSAITFTLTKLAPVSGNRVTVEGNLTIAGTTKAVSITATSKTNANGDLVFSGSKALKMTDFNVEPPVVLLGTLKTGNDITISFETSFASNASLTQK